MADLPFSRDLYTRYHSGFDRWNPEALNGREICCSRSCCLTHAMDRQGGIWWWYMDEQLWYRMDPVHEPIIRAESDCFVAQMRKALPLIRIFAETRFEGEREAANTALCKLAEAVNKVFKQTPHDAGALITTRITTSDLYYGLTQTHRWQVPDLDPPKYDETVANAIRQRAPPMFSEAEYKALMSEVLARHESS